MAKKILALCAALMAFAVVPAVASATNSPELRDPLGPVLANSTILATSNAKAVMTDASNGSVILECETALMTGKVTKNDGSNIEGDIEKAEFHNAGGAGCTGAFGAAVPVTPSTTSNPGTNGLPWCIRSTSTMVTDEFQVRGNSCNNLARPIRFILHAPFGNECIYQRTAAIIGTFTTGTGKTVLSITAGAGSEFERLSGAFPCPAKARLAMSFTLETDVSPFERVDIL
jgi:hypothetical protein